MMGNSRVRQFIPIGLLAFSLYPFLLISLLELASSFNIALLTRIFGALLYNLIFFALLFALLLGFSNKFVSSVFSTVLWLFLFGFTFCSIYHFLIFGQPLGLPSIYSVLDTDMEESREFIESILRLDFLIWAALAAIPLAYAIKVSINRVSPAYFSLRTTLILVGALTGLSLVGLQRAYLRDHNPILFMHYAMIDSVHQKRAVLKASESLRAAPLDVFSNTSEAATHILVLGEATTRRHMSLYGYGRPTSPNLIALRPQLHIAENVCSSRGNTIAQLQELLTFASREDRSPLFNDPNLLEIMKAAGFKTFWLSNQRSVGDQDSWSAIFARSADARVFVNKLDMFSGISLDEKLVAPFSDALADPSPKKFIVLHLAGAHSVYALRYPSSFAKFSSTDGVDPRVVAKRSFIMDNLLNTSNSPISQYNAYDNAVLYNDFIVSEFIKMSMRLDHATLTYISDHGEAIFESSDYVGHLDGPAPRQVYEVPLLFYLSPDIHKLAENSSPFRIANFERNSKKPFQSDRLIHTLLDLFAIEYSKVDKSSSLFSPSFVIRPRFCDGLPD